MRVDLDSSHAATIICHWQVIPPASNYRIPLPEGIATMIKIEILIDRYVTTLSALIQISATTASAPPPKAKPAAAPRRRMGFLPERIR